MGLYVHEGGVGTHVMLREFIAGTTHRCAVPTGYGGRPGEIRYVRVLPEPFESVGFGYSCWRRLTRQHESKTLTRANHETARTLPHPAFTSRGRTGR
jgi:hypothetical protein